MFFIANETWHLMYHHLHALGEKPLLQLALKLFTIIVFEHLYLPSGSNTAK